MRSVSALLRSQDEELIRLAVTAMAAMSAASPGSPVMHDSIPLRVGACRDPSFGFYPLTCLSNITVDPRNAAACVAHLSELFTYVRSEDSAYVQRAVVTIYRIVQSAEGVHAMNGPELMAEFYDTTQALWDGEHSPILIDIVEVLTAQADVCAALERLGMAAIVKSQLMSCQLNDPNRPKFMRVWAQLLAAGD